VDPLIRALAKDGLIPVAAGALHKITGLGLGDDYDSWKRWWSQNNADPAQ
jgi:hypothetical protein